MIEPTESESKAELDRFCDAMISIYGEIRAIETGEADRQDNVLKKAPHTAQDLLAESWDRSYSRESAAFPAPWTRQYKYWPPVGRIDNVYGDRNLFCTCPGVPAEAARDGMTNEYSVRQSPPMFKIVDRYVSGQVLSTVTWSVAMLSLMLVVGNALRDLLNLLISHQLPVSYIISFIGYLLPFSMIYSIPWGILVAVLLVFGKLSSDNELVALRANGSRHPADLLFGFRHKRHPSCPLPMD